MNCIFGYPGDCGCALGGPCQSTPTEDWTSNVSWENLSEKILQLYLGTPDFDAVLLEESVGLDFLVSPPAPPLSWVDCVPGQSESWWEFLRSYTGGPVSDRPNPFYPPGEG